MRKALIIGILGCISLVTSLVNAQSNFPFINNAVVNYGLNTLTVSGSNLGSTPKITLGVVALTTQTATSTQIVANFPPTALPSSFTPGTYFLLVTYRNSLPSIFTVAIGTAGPQGLVGPQGVAGPMGFPGSQGPQGNPGMSGTNGAPGTPGKDGQQGTPGKDGLPGQPGTPGTDGLPGHPGATGATGPTGASGPSGHSPFCGEWAGSCAGVPYQIGDMVTDHNGNPGPYYNLTGAGTAAASPANDPSNWLYCCNNGKSAKPPASLTGTMLNVPAGSDAVVPLVGNFDGGGLPCPGWAPGQPGPATPACSWTSTAKFNVSSFSATYSPTAGAPPAPSVFVVRVCTTPGDETTCGYLGGGYPTCQAAPGSISCSNQFSPVVIPSGSAVSMEVGTGIAWDRVTWNLK
jgi:hypothetical protein